MFDLHQRGLEFLPKENHQDYNKIFLTNYILSGFKFMKSLKHFTK